MDDEVLYQIISKDGYSFNLKESILKKTEFGQKYVINQQFMKPNLCIELPFYFSSIVCVFFDCIPNKQYMYDFVDCLLFLNPSFATLTKIQINNYLFIENKLMTIKDSNDNTMGYNIKASIQIENETERVYQFFDLQFVELINLIDCFMIQNQTISYRVVMMFLMKNLDYEKIAKELDIDDVVVTLCDKYFSKFKNKSKGFNKYLFSFLEIEWVNHLKDETLKKLAETISPTEIIYQERQKRIHGIRLFQHLLKINNNNVGLLDMYCKFHSVEETIQFCGNEHLVFYLSTFDINKHNEWLIRQLINGNKFVPKLNESEKLSICQNILRHGLTRKLNPNYDTVLFMDDFAMKPQMIRVIIIKLNETIDSPPTFLGTWLTFFNRNK